MPRNKRYSFEAIYAGDRPQSGHADRAVIKITDPDGTRTTLELSPAELRSLQRAALTGLGYTKVDRTNGQWGSTWAEDIAQKIEPILVVTKALLPVETPKTPKQAQ